MEQIEDSEKSSVDSVSLPENNYQDVEEQEMLIKLTSGAKKKKPNVLFFVRFVFSFVFFFACFQFQALFLLLSRKNENERSAAILDLSYISAQLFNELNMNGIVVTNILEQRMYSVGEMQSIEYFDQSYQKIEKQLTELRSV